MKFDLKNIYIRIALALFYVLVASLGKYLLHMEVKWWISVGIVLPFVLFYSKMKQKQYICGI
ncbi:TPA: hypothetical protein ACGO91_002242, partial [Streptococcus suis]